MKLEDDLTRLLLLYTKVLPSLPVDNEVFARQTAREIIELVTNSIRNSEFKLNVGGK